MAWFLIYVHPLKSFNVIHIIWIIQLANSVLLLLFISLAVAMAAAACNLIKERYQNIAIPKIKYSHTRQNQFTVEWAEILHRSFLYVTLENLVLLNHFGVGIVVKPQTGYKLDISFYIRREEATQNFVSLLQQENKVLGIIGKGTENRKKNLCKGINPWCHCTLSVKVWSLILREHATGVES